MRSHQLTSIIYSARPQTSGLLDKTTCGCSRGAIACLRQSIAGFGESAHHDLTVRTLVHAATRRP